MSRKIPLCAYCGNTLHHSDRILVIFKGIKGKPCVAWQIDCYKNDVIKIGEANVTDPNHDPLKIIATIEKRGSGRVLLTNKPKGAK